MLYTSQLHVCTHNLFPSIACVYRYTVTHSYLVNGSLLTYKPILILRTVVITYVSLYVNEDGILCCYLFQRIIMVA